MNDSSEIAELLKNFDLKELRFDIWMLGDIYDNSYHQRVTHLPSCLCIEFETDHYYKKGRKEALKKLIEMVRDGHE